MVLFDVRTDDSHAGYIADVNRSLDSVPENPYLARFGPVCSPRWWACFDRGELPVEVLSGEVLYTGPRLDPFDEIEDVIEFSCGALACGDWTAAEDVIVFSGVALAYDDRTVAYDRVGPWAAHPIRVGDRVSLTRTVIELRMRYGPYRYQVDLRAEWFPASGARGVEP